MSRKSQGSQARESQAAPQRRRGRGFVVSAMLLLVGISAVWAAGLVWFAASIPNDMGDTETSTDAIVVLTGGSQRLIAGFDLMGEGKAKKLFISGVHPGVELGELLRVSHHPEDWITCCITLGHSADSTLGNAVETANWMRSEGFTSIRLVTANYHMRRSLFEFHRVMPQIRIVAHPVFPEPVKHTNWWLSPNTAWLIITEYNKYLGAVLRAVLVPLDPAGSPDQAKPDLAKAGSTI